MNFIKSIVIEIPKDETEFNDENYIKRKEIISRVPEIWFCVEKIKFSKRDTRVDIIFQNQEPQLFKDMKCDKEIIYSQKYLHYLYQDNYCPHSYKFKIFLNKEVNGDNIISILQYIREEMYRIFSEIYGNSINHDNPFIYYDEIILSGDRIYTNGASV